jgi:hypothetical protein
MEVAMTRTAIRHTLSALAALAVVTAFATSPVSAQSDVSNKQEMEYLKQEKRGATNKPNKFTTKQRRPVACDCTNCSADHCNRNPNNLQIQSTGGPGFAGPPPY